jgi:hypothetical protein
MTTRLSIWLALAAIPLALAGCFGGDDGDAPVPADPLAAVPDSATQSIAGTVDYLNVLNQNPTETREAVDVTAVVLPTSDTTEPQPL